MVNKATIRKRAQRGLPSLAGQKCEDCPATEGLERHHPNYSKPDEFRVLCADCHVKADLRDGSRRKKQMKLCKVCGKPFLPSHSKKSNTCGRECLVEIGRRNALKRWHPNGQVESGPGCPESPRA